MATKKGVAKRETNIKRLAAPGEVLAVLPVGGWVIGNLSPGGTDLIDIMEWYTPAGVSNPLSAPCKASISTNLTVTDYIVPDPETPPVGGEDAHIEIEIVAGVVQSVIVNEKVFKQQ